MHRLIVLSTLSVLFHAAVLLAGNDLDDILSGFDESGEQQMETEDNELDDALTGFEDFSEDGTANNPESEKKLPSWLAPYGSLSLETSWNFAHEAPAAGEPDYRGLSMLRTTGALGVDIDMGAWRGRAGGHAYYDAAWVINGRDQYSDGFLDRYEDEIELDELYLAGNITKNLDLKTGRQIVVWGKADNVRVTDILNPLNNRTPGMVDIKYKRLPVTMSKLDYYFGNWNLSTILIHEIRFDKNPVFNSEFFPGKTAPPPEHKPTNFSLDTQQYGLALNGIFSGWDFSFYYAGVYDGRSHLVRDNGIITLQHNRVYMTGMTGNIALGNWLLKGEGAWWRGLEYSNSSNNEFARIDLMAGIEYTGFSETMLSLEVVNRHIPQFEDSLKQSPDYTDRNQTQSALMLTRDFLNDTVQLKILCTLFGTHGEGGAFERLQVEYDYTDHIAFTGGVILYQSGDQVGFSDIGDSDRLFLEFKYSL
ncbi:DUF1302 family protein [Desulfomarina sp.]